MKAFLSLAASLFLIAVFLCRSSAAQCKAFGLVKGADKYDALVCRASAAAQSGHEKEALDLYLSASKESIFESPNVLLFGDIALMYAKLGELQDADRYLAYDDISILWMIGIVRCEGTPDLTEERLLKDGKPLVSEAARHMIDVLCGPIFDEYSDFHDSNAQSFVPAAKAILRHEAIRKEVEALRSKQALRR